jgi:hypothetical protein
MARRTRAGAHRGGSAVTATEDSTSPAERVEDDDKIVFEMRQAVREALGQHKRAGNPVAVWRNERVEWIPTDQIPDEFATPLPEPK